MLLCLREDLDIWNLPGGRVERGVSPWKAVVREVNEEAGPEVEVERLAGVYWRAEGDGDTFLVCASRRGRGGQEDVGGGEARYFALERVPEKSKRRHLEMTWVVRDHRGETLMKGQAEPSSRELIERGLL